MELAKDDGRDYNKATHCYGCNRSFEFLTKNRDHDHVTGQYKGAACSRCNLSFKPRKGKSKFTKRDAFLIPVILHGGSNYDFKLILRDFSTYFSPEEISVIPNNTERYIGFEIGNFRFIDSCKFLNASLEALVENLHGSGTDKFRFTRKSFNGSESVFRKGVYPYEYMDKIERFF